MFPILAVEFSPQRGPGYEHVPPSLAHMGQRDYILISVFRIPKVRDESEDFGGDPVDRCDHVFPGPDQAEDLGSVLLENVQLKYNACQS